MPTLIRRREFLAGSAAILATSRVAWASNHRSSPSVDNDIATNITDFYMFRSPRNANKLVVVMNTHPFSVPAEANTYHYQTNAVYRFNFTTDPTAVPTAHIDFVFAPFANGKQSFTAFFPDGTVVTGDTTQGEETSDKSNPPVITHGPAGSGIAIFAGPRDDPFFFDVVDFQRLVGGTGTTTFSGLDSFAGFNVMSIVVEFPIVLVTGGAPQFGAWAATYIDENPRDLAAAGRGIHPPRDANLLQHDRGGNPLVNAALIPASLKDAFNMGAPTNDAHDFEPAILQTLAGFGTNAANTQTLISVIIPDTLKLDLGKPDGFPNGRRLQDRVQDIILSIALNDPGFTDHTPGNDVPFLNHFPFLAHPHQATG